jgi:phosphoribosyl 1,2-cyclic phosphodiesterase
MQLALLRRELQICVLASGSGGNCTYVGDGHKGLLIDAGISARQTLARLELAGLKEAPIDAVLITHEHSDHVGAARVLCDRLRRRAGRSVPFYMTAGTRGRLLPQTTPDALEVVHPNRSFQVGHLLVEPFSVPHDTAEPVAWRVQVDGRWVGVITDLGRPTSLVVDKLRSLSVAIVEFNHDLAMLMQGSYPWALKQRIRSSHGHLSNEQGAELLRQGIGPALEDLVLGHLSEENNRPALALEAASSALQHLGALGQVRLSVAAQDRPTRLAAA